MLQAAWRRAPARLREAIGPRLEFSARRAALGAPPPPAHAPGPLVVSHYGDMPFGIGRAGVLTAAALREAGFVVLEHDLRPALEDRRIDAGALPASGGVWITHCNPEHAAALMSHIARADWARRYRIGYWAWELPRAPAFWLWLSRFFDEIWTPSAYAAESLASASAPVRVMPHPVPLAAQAQGKGGAVRILAMADLRSAEARKNPLGAIEAFKRAFPTPQAAALLRVKLNGVTFDANALARLRAAADRPDIEIIDRVYAESELDALFAETDLYLSLHRAEGFGLPIAEAMARGTPALATGWSGNLQFMAGMDDALVKFSMVPVRDSSGVYRDKHARWAEPDLDDAARKLRRLVDDETLRARLGEAARARVSALSESWRKPALETQPWRRLIR